MYETTRLSNFGRAEEKRSLYSGSLNRAGSTVDKLSEGVIGVIVMNIVCSYFVNVLVTAIVVVAEVSIVSNKDVTASRDLRLVFFR